MESHLRHTVFKKLGALADKTNTDVYVIGGFVRDIFLNRPSKDIDILVLGNGVNFAEEAGKTLKSEVAVFKNFGTAMLRFQDLEIEFVGARKESYRSDSGNRLLKTAHLTTTKNVAISPSMPWL